MSEIVDIKYGLLPKHFAKECNNVAVPKTST